MKIKCIVIIFFCFLQMNGQIDFAKPDFFKIQNEVNNKSSKYYLPKLIDDFKRLGSKMTDDEMHYLYYGYRMVHDYTPLSLSEKEGKISYMTNKDADCSKVVAMCNKLLEDDPFDLDYLTTKHTCEYELSNNQREADDNFKLLYSIFMTIRKTGLGTSINKPMYVINENHINRVLDILGYIPNGEKEYHENIVFIGVEQNFLNKKGIYFDITLINQQHFDDAKNIAIASTSMIKEKTEIKRGEVAINEPSSSLSNATSKANTAIEYSSKEVKNTENLVAKADEVEETENLSPLEERRKKAEEIRQKRAQELEERKLEKEMLRQEQEQIRARLLEERKQLIEERRKAVEERRREIEEKRNQS